MSSKYSTPEYMIAALIKLASLRIIGRKDDFNLFQLPARPPTSLTHAQQVMPSSPFQQGPTPCCAIALFPCFILLLVFKPIWALLMIVILMLCLLMNTRRGQEETSGSDSYCSSSLNDTSKNKYTRSVETV